MTYSAYIKQLQYDICMKVAIVPRYLKQNAKIYVRTKSDVRYKISGLETDVPFR